MSGGVDSSVAAYLLKEQGYECIGVFLRVGAAQTEPDATCQVAPHADATGSTTTPHGRQPRRLRHGCCSANDALDARAVAGRLGIPFYALNFQADFERIIDDFVEEYGQARTPNPCVQCNIHLKFGKLLRYADAVDAQFVATGHYARVLRDGAEGAEAGRSGGSVRLARALNRAKDQSYVLFGIRREDLPRCLFPLGEFADKAAVRRIAADLGLRVHDKPDSQEICFVPDNDYRRLVAVRRPELLRAGDMVDSAGRIVGRHAGVAAYTIGQRHGLGVALGRPMYVTRLNVLDNTVTIGPRDELLSRGLIAQRTNWLVPYAPMRRTERDAGGSLGRPASSSAHGARRTATRCAIKIRHMHVPAEATIDARFGQEVAAVFDEPQSAVTPGQAAVFYEGDVVLGGGWIRSPLHEADVAAIRRATSG